MRCRSRPALMLPRVALLAVALTLQDHAFFAPCHMIQPLACRVSGRRISVTVPPAPPPVQLACRLLAVFGPLCGFVEHALPFRLGLQKGFPLISLHPSFILGCVVTLSCWTLFVQSAPPAWFTSPSLRTRVFWSKSLFSGQLESG